MSLVDQVHGVLPASELIPHSQQSILAQDMQHIEASIQAKEINRQSKVVHTQYRG